MTEKVLHGVVLVRWLSRYIDTHIHVVFNTVTLVHICFYFLECACKGIRRNAFIEKGNGSS